MTINPSSHPSAHAPMWKEFKEFAIRGSVIDLAIGVIIGAAFSPIVASLVNDVIMPPIGLLTGGVDFTNLFVVLREGTEVGSYVTLGAAEAAGAVTINYGRFINSIVSFLIVAFVIFLVVKAINRMRREEAAAPAAPPAPTREETLLTEIRDLLATGRTI